VRDAIRGVRHEKAEKISALRTEDYFRERSARANIAKAKRILKKAGRGNPPTAGDEA
jgi:hypothetical protein